MTVSSSLKSAFCRNAFVPSVILLCSAAPSGAAEILINNGLATNVINTDQGINHVRIENSPLPAGAPTTVTFEAGAQVLGNDGNDNSVLVIDTSAIVVNGGNFLQDVTVFDGASLTATGGTFNDDIYAVGFSTANISGATVVDDVVIQGSASASITSGLFGDDIFVENAAMANISGGTVVEDVVALGFATVLITGGSFGEDIIADGPGASISISGGLYAQGGIPSLDVGFGTAFGGTITLFGSAFAVNGSPVGSGLISNELGDLSATLADGSSFTAIPFDRNPTASPNTADWGAIELVIIPEPSAAALFAAGGLLLLRRRR